MEKNERFDPISWQKDKILPPHTKDRYSLERQSRELVIIENQINNALLTAHDAYLADGLEYGIVGIALYGSWVHQTAHKGSDIDACELGNRYYQFENDFGYFLQKAGLKYPFEVWSNINLDTKEGSAGFLGNGYKIISPFPNVVEEADQTINALILSQDVIKGKIY